MTADLQNALTAVEALVKAAEARIGPPPAFSDQAWFERRRSVYAELHDQLVRRLDARIVDRWDGARVRLAGLSSSCTAGLPGALVNWMRAARRRLAERAAS